VRDGGEYAVPAVTSALGLGGSDAERAGRPLKARDASLATSALPARFGRNVFMNYAAQGLTALSALVLTPVLLHHLGKTTYGLWVVAGGAVAYLELFELGFGGATTKLIAEDASIRPEQAVRTLNTTFFVLVPLGVVALIAGVGLAFGLPHIVHVATDLRTSFVVVVAVLAVALAVSIPGDTFGGALVGHQRYDLLAASNASMTLVTAGACVAVVVLGGGIVLLAVTSTAISILFQLVRLAMVSRIMPGTRISPRLVDPTQRRHALHLSGWFLLQAVLAAIYTTGDVMIVGIVLGLRDAAIYAVGSKLAAAAISGLDSMAQVFFPYASAAARNREPGALAEIAIDGTRASLAAGLMISLVFIVLASPGIRAWVGPGYATSAQVLVVLAAATALASPVRALSNILNGTGKLPLVCAIRSVEVTVNLVLSITLALVMGPVGVAVGTLGGILLVRLPGYLVAGCRSTGLRVSTFLWRAVVPNILPALGCAAVLLGLRSVVGQSLPWLMLQGALGAATYLVLYFTTGATPGERQRGLAFITRPLPTRWRPHTVVAASLMTHDETL
jgi:O-antigen/teichoic acid export membrane protein